MTVIRSCMLSTFMVFATCICEPALADNKFLQQGIREYNAGNYLRAVGLFGAAQPTEFNNPLLHYYMGNSYARLQQKPDAIREYNLALTLQPEGKIADYCRAALSAIGSGSERGAPTTKTPSHASSPGSLKEKGQLPQVIYLICGCALCRRLEPIMRDLQSKYYDRVVFTRAYQDRPDQPTKEIMKHYNVSRCPSVLFLDGNGELRYERTGAISEEDLYENTKNIAQHIQLKTANDQHFKQMRDQILKETEMRILEERRRVATEIQQLESDMKYQLPDDGSTVRYTRHGPVNITSTDQRRLQQELENKEQALKDDLERKTAELREAASDRINKLTLSGPR